MKNYLTPPDKYSFVEIKNNINQYFVSKYKSNIYNKYGEVIGYDGPLIRTMIDEFPNIGIFMPKHAHKNPDGSNKVAKYIPPIYDGSGHWANPATHPAPNTEMDLDKIKELFKEFHNTPAQLYELTKEDEEDLAFFSKMYYGDFSNPIPDGIGDVRGPAVNLDDIAQYVQGLKEGLEKKIRQDYLDKMGIQLNRVGFIGHIENNHAEHLAAIRIAEAHRPLLFIPSKDHQEEMYNNVSREKAIQRMMMIPQSRVIVIDHILKPPTPMEALSQPLHFEWQIIKYRNMMKRLRAAGKRSCMYKSNKPGRFTIKKNHRSKFKVQTKPLKIMMAYVEDENGNQIDPWDSFDLLRGF